MVILLAGGSGLLGSALQEELLKEGHEVRILSRRQNTDASYFQWNPDTKTIDARAFQNLDVLINLVGASIADGRWTSKRKKMLLESRTLSTEFLIQSTHRYAPDLPLYIGSSAVGIYGDRAAEVLDENSPAGEDYLSELATKWEAAHQKAELLSNTRRIIFRIGIVLDNAGGAYPVLKKNMILGIAPYFGKDIYYPLIHIKDLIKAFVWAIDNTKSEGVYNLTGPKPEHQIDVFKYIGRHSGKGFIPLPAPKLFLSVFMGEKASIVTNSNRVIPKRLMEDGFLFQYPNAEDMISALEKG